MTTAKEFIAIVKNAPTVVPTYRVISIPDSRPEGLKAGDVLFLYDDTLRLGGVDGKEYDLPLSCIEFIEYAMVWP